jgi:hypothetical protein
VVGVAIELGAGVARVGSAEVAITPASGGVRVGDVTLVPLSFAARARLVADARATGTVDALGAAVLSQAAGAPVTARTHTAVLEAIALHLAGARASGHALPGFASALVAMTCGAGWSPASAVDAPADLVDRLAEAVLAGIVAVDDESDGWTRITFPPGDGVAQDAASEPSAVRDALVADLVRRDAEALTREAVELAQRASRSAAGRQSDDVGGVGGTVAAASVMRETGMGAPTSAAMRRTDAGGDGAAGAADAISDAGPAPAAAGGAEDASRAASARYPEPIAAAPSWPTSPGPRAPAPSSWAAAAASNRGPLQTGSAPPSSRVSVSGDDLARTVAPPDSLRAVPTAAGDMGTALRTPVEPWRAIDVPDLLALSDALGEALDEEADLRGLEPA